MGAGNFKIPKARGKTITNARFNYIRVLYVLRVAIVLRSIEIHPMVLRFGLRYDIDLVR